MTRARQRTQRGQKLADAWNAAHPIGTPVRYWTGVREGAGRESVTRSRAQEMSGSGVVWVEGQAGSIALSHVEPLSKPFDAAALVWRKEGRWQIGTAVVPGLRFECKVRPRPGATGEAVTCDWKWWSSCSLTGVGPTPITWAFGANSWQACRAAMQRQARAWCAEHGKGEVAG